MGVAMVSPPTSLLTGVLSCILMQIRLFGEAAIPPKKNYGVTEMGIGCSVPPTMRLVIMIFMLLSIVARDNMPAFLWE